MKVEWMRTIDRRVGRPISFLVSLVINNRDVSVGPGEHIHTVVVSKYFGAGSITLSTPLLQALKEKFPNAKLVFITFQNNAELLELFPFIDEVITIRSGKVRNFLADTLKTIAYLRFKMRPNLFVDMEFFSHYSSLMAWLSGAGVRVGFHTSLLPRGRILTHKVTFNAHRYITEAFQALGQKIGAMTEYPLFKPTVNRAYTHYTSEWLKTRGLHAKNYIVINTQSSDHLGELKKWKVEKWTRLISQMVETLRVPVVLTGLKADHDEIKKIITPLPDHIKKSVFNTAGEFSLGAFLALLEMSRFLVTIDSGPLHLSQSLNIPCVALFGPETPVLYGSRKKYDRTVYMDLYCSPCCNVLEGKKAECTNPVYKECMENISADRLWREVADLNKHVEEVTRGNRPLPGMREH